MMQQASDYMIHPFWKHPDLVLNIKRISKNFGSTKMILEIFVIQIQFWKWFQTIEVQFNRNWNISNTTFKNWVVPYGHFKKSSGSMEPLEPPLTAPLILLSLFFCKISLQMIGECHGKAIIDPLFMVYDNKQMPKNE